MAESDNQQHAFLLGLTGLHLDTSPQHEFVRPWKNSDYILIVENQRLHVHRYILEMVSPVFQMIFSKQAKQHSNEIYLHDKKVLEFVDFLRQVYPQFTSEITFLNFGHIYALAEEFRVESVLTACRTFLASTNITYDNAIAVLAFAQKYKADEVRKRCCQGLQTLTASEIENDQYFKELDVESLRDILIPKTKRLEQCIQVVLPQLLGLIDCALYLWSNYPLQKLQERDLMNGKPKLCPLHYDVTTKRAKRDTLFEGRLNCEACKSMMVGMKDLSYDKATVYGGSRCFYTAGPMRFDETISNVLKEIHELLKPKKTQP